MKLINILLCICIYLMPVSISAQLISPFNGRVVRDTSADYTFIVSGHFHGSSENKSTFPAATLLAGIDTLNSLKPSFLICLGDLFLDVNDTYIANYQKALFNKLDMPLFNAVGNHDRANGNRYEKEYGKSFYYFLIGQQLYVVLNTELNDGNIKGDQLEMLNAALQKIDSAGVKHLFIFSHRPVWAEGNKRYETIFEGNTKSKLGVPNFAKELLPLLEKLHVQVYWLSGSTGGGPSSFFYDVDERTGITFIQTAIRDTERDAVLLVQLRNGSVYFKGISLATKELQPIEKYGIGYWTKNKTPEIPFNLRLLPYLTWLMISHHYFWIGIVSGAIILIILRSLRTKWKTRK